MFILTKSNLKDAINDIFGSSDDNIKTRRALEKEVLDLKRSIAELEHKKMLEEKEISHLVKMKEEKIQIETEKKRLELQGNFDKKVMELQKDYHEKVLALLQEEHGKMEDIYQKIMDRLPNVNVTMKR